MSQNYSEKLRDPRWQRMRLQIFERDKWKCRLCSSAENTLNVHHRYYLKGRDPWDYPPEALATLCDFCHEGEHALSSAGEKILRILREIGFFNYTFDLVSALIQHPKLEVNDISFILINNDNKEFLEELRSLIKKHQQYIRDNSTPLEDLPFT